MDIPRLSKETSIFKPGAIAGGIADASEKATEYITEVTNDGIWVTPSDAKPDAQGQATSSTSGWHIGGALELVREGVSVIKAWLDGSTPKVRVGDETGGNALIEPTSFSIRNATTVLAKFAASLVEIGKNSTSAIVSFCGGRGYIYSSSSNEIRVSSHDRNDDLGDTDTSGFVSVSASSTKAAVSMSALPYGAAGASYSPAQVKCEAGSASTASSSIVTVEGNRLKAIDEPSYNTTNISMNHFRKILSIESGYVGQDNTVNAGSYKDVSVAFYKTFDSAPRVVVGLLSTSTSADIGSISVAAHDVTTTGFKARLFNNSSTNRAPGFYWIAMQA